MESYKKLIVWQKGIELVKEIYGKTRLFPKEEQFTLISQMRRSALSIPCNIAEGATRKTTKEFLQFVRIAYSSSAELETQLIVAHSLYAQISLDIPFRMTDEVQKLLHNLIKSLVKKI